jgi:hypothetical protein
MFLKDRLDQKRENLATSKRAEPNEKAKKVGRTWRFKRN